MVDAEVDSRLRVTFPRYIFDHEGQWSIEAFGNYGIDTFKVVVNFIFSETLAKVYISDVPETSKLYSILLWDVWVNIITKL